jgi:hypothetical protein
MEEDDGLRVLLLGATMWTELSIIEFEALLVGMGRSGLRNHSQGKVKK